MGNVLLLKVPLVDVMTLKAAFHEASMGQPVAKRDVVLLKPWASVNEN